LRRDNPTHRKRQIKNLTKSENSTAKKIRSPKKSPIYEPKKIDARNFRVPALMHGRGWDNEEVGLCQPAAVYCGPQDPDPWGKGPVEAQATSEIFEGGNIHGTKDYDPQLSPQKK